MQIKKYAFEISGGIQICEAEGRVIDTKSVFPDDDDWPSALALLIKTKNEDTSDD